MGQAKLWTATESCWRWRAPHALGEPSSPGRPAGRVRCSGSPLRRRLAVHARPPGWCAWSAWPAAPWQRRPAASALMTQPRAAGPAPGMPLAWVVSPRGPVPGELPVPSRPRPRSHATQRILRTSSVPPVQPRPSCPAAARTRVAVARWQRPRGHSAAAARGRPCSCPCCPCRGTASAGRPGSGHRPPARARPGGASRRRSRAPPGSP
mmetsp:Transcript_44985/g.125158  ORF Transcript_44985/g.125158 Transcript_44985/m.125158 type:complete len:208 (+) Transcript_44985:37-660(+)